MRFRAKKHISLLLTLLLVVTGLIWISPSAANVPPPQNLPERNGITVGEPKVYDDALLQRMLQQAEARLAALQPLESKLSIDKLGAVSGASLQSTGFALNVQGAPLPQVVTNAKGATGSTDETTQLNAAGTATGGSVSTKSGLATQDVTTTRPQITSPGASAPTPSVALPSSNFSVSSSDILNEQMQLTAEINGLRLLLAGSLSDHFIRSTTLGNNLTKLKMTIGFPITVIPDQRYKDAVAVVEVEVEKRLSLSNERPAIVTLLPREKTYNVASVNNTSKRG